MLHGSGNSLGGARLPWRVLVSGFCGVLIVAACGGGSDEPPPPPPKMDLLAGDSASGTADGTGTAARFHTPAHIARDRAGNFYVADMENHAIRRITPAGVVSTFAGTPGVAGIQDGTGTAARFNRPYGVAVDALDTVYVADTSNATIRAVSPAGVVTTIAGAAGQAAMVDDFGIKARFMQPKDVAFDPSGVLYITDFTAVRKMVLAARQVSTLAGATAAGYADGNGSNARFDFLNGIALDRNGNLYVADTRNYVIRKVTPLGEVTTVAGKPRVQGVTDGAAGVGLLYWPWDVALRDTGDLYVADVVAHTVRKIAPDGSIGTVVGVATTPGWQMGSLPGLLSFPASLLFVGNTLAIAQSHGVVLVTNAP